MTDDTDSTVVQEDFELHCGGELNEAPPPPPKYKEKLFLRAAKKATKDHEKTVLADSQKNVLVELYRNARRDICRNDINIFRGQNDFEISHVVLNDHCKFQKGLLAGSAFKSAHIDYQSDPDDLITDRDGFNYERMFRYKATGLIPDNGRIPVVGAEKYRNIISHVKIYNDFEDNMLSDVRKGVDLSWWEKETNRKLHEQIDVVCRYKGRPAMISLRTTGLLTRSENMRQAIMWVWLGKLVNNIDYDFYFYAISRTDPKKMKLFRVDVLEEQIDDIKNEITMVGKSVLYHERVSWHADKMNFTEFIY